MVSTANVAARLSKRMSGQKVRTSTDPESVIAVAISSHCSQETGMSHSTCSRPGQGGGKHEQGSWAPQF